MKEIRALTGLRGIAALIVFWDHTRGAFADRGVTVELPVLFERLFLSGGRQVDIFFVLSGFILSLIYRDWFTAAVTRAGYFSFLRKRIARVWPLHVAVILAVLGMVLASKLLGATMRNGLERFDFATLPQHLLLVHAWGWFMHGEGAWNPPSWSVSVELFAYLVFPFLLLFSARAATRGWWMLAGAAVAGFALNATTHWGISGYAALARGLSEFTLGALLVYVADGRVAEWLRSSTGSLVALLTLTVGFALVADTGFAIGLVTAPLLLSLCGDNPVSRVLGSRPIFFLGEISYSIYLGHFLYTSTSYRLISFGWAQSGPLPALATFLFVNAFVIGLSTLTYYLIEQPARDWLSGTRKRRPVEAALAGKA